MIFWRASSIPEEVMRLNLDSGVAYNSTLEL
jgi:carbon starvation protein CstA